MQSKAALIAVLCFSRETRSKNSASGRKPGSERPGFHAGMANPSRDPTVKPHEQSPSVSAEECLVEVGKHSHVVQAFVRVFLPLSTSERKSS